MSLIYITLSANISDKPLFRTTRFHYAASLIILVSINDQEGCQAAN